MSVTTYNSYEEMMQAMAENEDAANSRVSERQREVTWGSHYVGFHPYADDVIVIFGYVFTQEQANESELRAGASEEDAADAAAALANAHERGYRFGRGYSSFLPEGELGSTHISTIWPVSKELFDAAMVAGWDFSVLAVSEPEMLRAFQDYCEYVVEHVDSDVEDDKE